MLVIKNKILSVKSKNQSRVHWVGLEDIAEGLGSLIIFNETNQAF